MLNSHGHDVGTEAAAFGCWPGLSHLHQEVLDLLLGIRAVFPVDLPKGGRFLHSLCLGFIQL